MRISDLSLDVCSSDLTTSVSRWLSTTSLRKRDPAGGRRPPPASRRKRGRRDRASPSFCRLSSVGRKRLMQRFLIFIDYISAAVGKLFAWSIVLLTLAVSYEVFSRYLLGRPTTWAYDVGYILYGSLFIMAGASTPSPHAPVRGYVIYRLWLSRVQSYRRRGVEGKR